MLTAALVLWLGIVITMILVAVTTGNDAKALEHQSISYYNDFTFDGDIEARSAEHKTQFEAAKIAYKKKVALRKAKGQLLVGLQVAAATALMDNIRLELFLPRKTITMADVLAWYNEHSLAMEMAKALLTDIKAQKAAVKEEKEAKAAFKAFAKKQAKEENVELVFDESSPEMKFSVETAEAKEAGFLESLIGRFAAKYPQLQFAMAGAPGTPMAEIKSTNRERSNGNALAQFGDDVIKMQKSAEYNLLPCIRFGRGAKGGINTSDALPTHDELSETKGSAVRIDCSVAAGRYMFSAGSTVHTVMGNPNVTITGDNCMLYEVDDINDVRLMGDVANILLDNGWITISRGFAVKAGTELCMEFIKLADRTFHNAIEQRGYMRSMTTTPNQAEIPQGMPVFVGKLKQIGWYGNDGGAIFTNGLMKAFQDRFKSIGDRNTLNELLKGLATACKVVARLEGDTWMPYVYSFDEAINKKVKEVVKSLRTKTRLELLNEATKAELKAVKDIGETTAKRIVELRDRDGAFESFNDLYDRMVTEFGEVKAKYVKDAEYNFHRLAYSFTHKGHTYCVGTFLDEDQAKGRKTDLPDVGLIDAGSQGYEIYGWAISLDTRIDSARISLGWQVTQLMSEGFIAELLAEGASGHSQLKDMFSNILGKKNKLFEKLMERMNATGQDVATRSAVAMSMMKVLGKKMSERISSGLGAKAKSAYVQMMDLGCEFVIDRVPKGKNGKKVWKREAFFGRTPNQGHETIRKVEVLDAEFIAMAIKQFFQYKAANPGGIKLADVYASDHGYWKCNKRQMRAAKLISDVVSAHGENFVKVLKFLLAFLPTVAEGAIIVDTGLQELVCGDNDGDRNMISYDRLLIQIAGCVTKRHPETTPAKEQSKAFVVDTFADCVKADHGVIHAYEAFLKGDDKDMREIQVFLNAPGNSPGQDNVGGPTLTAAAPLNYHPWGWNDGKFGPKNHAARRFMDFLYALQQTAIDQQKYERVIASLRFWYRAQLWNNGMILPGTPVKGKEWAVVKGKKFFGANLSEEEATKLAAENGAQAVHCPNNYEIYGFEGMTFSQYRKLSLGEWQGAAEYVPLMTGISEGRKTVKARDPMWNNTALFNFGAWTVSAINLGLDYLTFEEMEALQPAFDCSGRAVKVDWAKLAEWFSTKCSRQITEEEVKANWVLPSMVSNYQKKGFNKDNSSSPGVFRYMRQRTQQIYIEECKEKGIDTGFDHPINILTENDVTPYIIESMDNPSKSVSYFNGWQAETVLRSMYFAYVDQASAAASNKSQSEKTQIDQVASGSEQKQFLRAALGAYRFLSVESKDLNYVTAWARTWRKALSVGKMAPQEKQDILAGMMVLGFRGLISMAKKDAGALLEGVRCALNLIKVLNLTLDDIEKKFINWERYKEYRDSLFGDANIEATMAENNITKREAIEMRERLDQARNVFKLESVLNYLAHVGPQNADESGMEFAAMEESEDLNLKIQDWIVGDFFGALEEAYADIERGEHRQDADHLVEMVLGVAEWEKSSIPMVKNMIRTEYWKFIKERAESYGEASTRDEVFAHYLSYRTEIAAEYRMYINPVIQAARLVEYANQTISTEGWIDPKECRNRFDRICYDGIYETDEEGQRHIRSSIEFEVPTSLKEGIVFHTAAAGYNVELLTDVPNLNVTRRPDDVRSLNDTTVSTRKGYIYIDSGFFALALDRFEPEVVNSWLRAQLECGVGHVTTADHILEAYNIWAFKNGNCNKDVNLEGEEFGRKHIGADDETFFRSYWTHSPLANGLVREDILKVQEFFMTCYSHIPVLNFYLNDDAFKSRHEYLEKEGFSDHEIMWQMDFEVTKSVYMPLFYGGKSKANSLFVGDAGDNKVTPYHLYRHFGFVMSGHADAQQQKNAPSEVVEWMDRYFGFPVGASKFVNKNASGNYMNQKHGTGNKKLDSKATESQQKALYKGDVENWDWNHAAPVNGFMKNFLIHKVETKKGLLPSPMCTTVKAIKELHDPSEDCWKAFGHLCRLSPSLMFCIAGVIDDGKKDAMLLAQMRASVKNQSVSSIRHLMRDAVRQRGFEMTLKSVSTDVNYEWDRSTMVDLLEIYNKEGK